MKPKDYPLDVAEALQGFLRILRKEASKHTDVIRIVAQSNSILLLKDLDSDFYFEVKNVDLNNDNDLTKTIVTSVVTLLTKQKALFNVAYKPISGGTHRFTGILTGEQLLDSLKNWVATIKKYNSLTFSEDDSINAAYEEEFYSEFDIVDEDADIKPFSFEQQKALNGFVNKLVENLEAKKDDYPVQDIIEDVKAIKKDLPISTKKKIIKSFAKAFAKMKKLGVEAFEDLVKDGMKDVMKEAFKIAAQAEVIKHIINH